MTRISKLWSKFFQGINWNVIKSTMSEQSLFHLQIGFLGRKPKQYIKKVVSGLLGSYFLGTNCKKKKRTNIQSKSLFFYVYSEQKYKKDIFFLEFSRVRSLSHRYKWSLLFLVLSDCTSFIHFYHWSLKIIYLSLKDKSAKECLIISRVKNVHCSRWKDCLSLGIPEYGVRSELV